jgi:hypothetical protein
MSDRPPLLACLFTKDADAELSYDEMIQERSVIEGSLPGRNRREGILADQEVLGMENHDALAKKLLRLLHDALLVTVVLEGEEIHRVEDDLHIR